MADASGPMKDTVQGQSSSERGWLASHWPEVAFFTGLTGMSMLAGFGTTLAAAKKSDPTYFGEGLTPKPVENAKSTSRLYESGSSLAARALARATLYSVGGFSLFCFAMWKLSGASNFEEFRQKMGRILPKIPRNDPPTSKVEFESLTDLFQYVIDQDRKEKGLKECSEGAKPAGQ